MPPLVSNWRRIYSRIATLAIRFYVTLMKMMANV